MTDDRIRLVIKQLIRCRLETNRVSSADTETVERIYENLAFDKALQEKLTYQALRLLMVLDRIDDPPKIDKPVLTGEALWKTIVDTSKP